MGGITQAARSLILRSRPDSELLDSALRGDALAFSEVYRRYEPRVHGFCMARLLSSDGAQDASQEVFMRLLAAEPGTIQAVGPWLFGVARHVCIDVARRENRREAPVDPEASAPVADPSPTIEEQVMSRGEAANIMLALRRIRPRYRTALVMREIHQLPMNEVAEALGVNEGAAYTVISRSRDAFGKAYAEVLDLPAGCAAAVEALYRKSGSGLTTAEASRLDQHLAACASCRKEARRAEDRGGLNALIPFLPVLSQRGRGLIAQAMTRLGESVPGIGSAVNYAPFIEPATLKAASFALAGTLAVVTGAAFVGGVASQAAIRESRQERTASAMMYSVGPSESASRTGGPALVRNRATSYVRAATTVVPPTTGYALGHAYGTATADGSDRAAPGDTASGPGYAAGPAGADERRPGNTEASPGPGEPGDGNQDPGAGTPGAGSGPNPDPGNPGAGSPDPDPGNPGAGSPDPDPSPDPGRGNPGAGSPDPDPGNPGAGSPDPDPGNGGSNPKAKP